MLLVSALSQGLDLKTDDQVAQVIQMTARKYEFSPSQVHVKLGIRVQLKITPRTIWSLSNAFTSAFKGLAPIPQFKATAKLGEFLEARFSQ